MWLIDIKCFEKFHKIASQSAVTSEVKKFISRDSEKESEKEIVMTNLSDTQKCKNLLRTQTTSYNNKIIIDIPT